MAGSERKKCWFLRSISRRGNRRPIDRPDGGPLDPRNRLQEIYAAVSSTTELEKNMTALFPEVRILVLGRSGSGKSTLIRLIVGEGGPATMSDGTAGKQNIAKEWVLRDGSVPLVFHDSNGTDVEGRKRLDEIESFLDEMRGKGKPIHLVWYIASGIDRRLRDDGGILGLICRKKIPFLLVITHNDWEEMVQENVTDEIVEKLLEGVEDKENVKKNIVRVGNRVKILANKQLEKKKVDVKALKLVSERTSQLINGDLKATWMAAQVVDMDGKLDESAKLIVHYMIWGAFASMLDPIPFVAQGELVIVFLRILAVLCKIWRVPKNFEHALLRTITAPEALQTAFRNLFRRLVGIAGLIATVSATALTGGIASPAMFVWLASYGAASARDAMSIRGCYSIVILGCIMYVKSIRGTSGTWDEEMSIEEYRELCRSFAASDRQDCLIRAVQEMKSMTGVIFRSMAHMDKLKSALVDCFETMILRRPNSLATLMGPDNATPEKVADDLALLQDSS